MTTPHDVTATDGSPLGVTSPAGFRAAGVTTIDDLAAARGWKPATVALYSKVARYGGLALPRAHTPEPAGMPPPEMMVPAAL